MRRPLVFLMTTIASLTVLAGDPDPTTYAADAKLMADICNKFTEDENAPRVHKAAIATQTARVIVCTDYNGECRLYSECLAKVIKASEDGNISARERGELRRLVSKLRAAGLLGERRLRHEAAKKESSSR